MNATATAVGALRVSVRASAGLTSLDQTTTASNASTTIAYGTWGDAPTGSLTLRSYRSLRLSAAPPATRVGWTVATYHVQWSNSSTFARLLGDVDAPATAGEAAVYTIAGLATGVPIYVRLAARVPVLFKSENIATPAGAIGPYYTIPAPVSPSVGSSRRCCCAPGARCSRRAASNPSC